MPLPIPLQLFIMPFMLFGDEPPLPLMPPFSSLIPPRTTPASNARDGNTAKRATSKETSNFMIGFRLLDTRELARKVRVDGESNSKWEVGSQAKL